LKIANIFLQSKIGGASYFSGGRIRQAEIGTMIRKLISKLKVHSIKKIK
jgi:hypothetical protein